MEEDTSLVWRKTLYLGSLNSNDLPRHFISMEEPKVITIDDVFDSTVMHINDLPRPNSTLTRPLCILIKGTHTKLKGNPVTGLNSAEYLLLLSSLDEVVKLTNIKTCKALLFFFLLHSFFGLRGKEMVNPHIKTWKSFLHLNSLD